MNHLPICKRHWQAWKKFHGKRILQKDIGSEVGGHPQPETRIYNSARHLQEWEASAIDPEITALNMVSLEGYAPYDRLFYSDGIKRLNSGRLPSWILKKYSHIEHGGWWASGVDPLTGEDDLWGCFKPDKPRIDSTKGKYQKYEHPLKAGATLFALKVPQSIWQKVSERYNVPIFSNDIDQNRADLGFWAWVIKNPQVSVTLTEGVKKAAALLSQGYAAIGLPGIWGGYRKNEGKPCLLPQLEIFANGRRQFKFAFDQDEKPKTRLANRKAVWHTAKLLKDKGCSVSIIEWEPWIKGVDDLIVVKGAKRFTECYLKALSFDDWQADGLKSLNHKVALRLDSSTKYIGEFSPPPAKLICLKAPKGSGKTEWLVQVCAEAQNRGQKVIVITHRTQLGKALCNRFGIDYVSELKDSDTQGVFGFGLCFDSLRRGGQARFNPDDWQGSVIILDECEQSIWHLLNARTEVSKHRVQVLRNFQQLIQNTLESDEGRVYLSDADLSDLSIDYVRSLANFPVEPWIAVKEGNPTPWNVTVWESADEILGAMVSHIRMGERVIISVDGQKAKSKWGTRNLENYLKKLFPDLRILRIDSKSIADPNNAAFGCVENLNEVLINYDIVITSPSIETGVSIDIKGHFSAVFDVAQGVIPVASVLQRMSRLREPVPRHVWAKGFGIGRIGNGSTSPHRIKESQDKQFKANFNFLAHSDYQFDFDAAGNFQPQALRTWAMMAARINSGMLRYQHEILRALVAEGHTIVDGDYSQIQDDDDEAQGTDQIKEELTESRNEIYQEQCEAIAIVPAPDDDRYKKLSEKQSRTVEETHELRKGELSRRYSEELVSSELVKLDDEGEYQKAQLHYYFTSGREFLSDREKNILEKQLESGEGELFLPDANRHLKGGKVLVLERLGIENLLAQDTEFSNKSQVLIDLSVKVKQHVAYVKNILGISIKEEDSPIAVGQKILRQCFGLALSTPVLRGARGHQVRHYQPVEVSQVRQRILEAWLARDLAARADTETTVAATSTVEVSMGVKSAFVSGCDTVITSGNKEYISSTDYHAQSSGLDMGVKSAFVSGCDTVITSGNKEYISGADYQVADYQVRAFGSEIEQLMEALPFVETADEFAAVIEGSPVEVVEDAIVLSGNQPRRRQLEHWYQALKTSEHPPLAHYKADDEVWAYFPQSQDGWLKGKVEWVRGNLIRVVSGFFGISVERQDVIALGDWVISS